ncbi:Low temperature viability protein [Biscogniauxia mediterranea]|nr:Low temperature viability protein [Biscogniauxia mediterranea]
MPRGKWIDKKTAQHFTLVHRPQNDPLIHDADAPAMVLNPTAFPNASKARKLDDLASELGRSEVEHVRANEGEAANYGVYFDDTEYDYMQHLRDLGSGSGTDNVVFLEANNGPSNKNKNKNKGKSLEVALRDLDLEEAERKKRELLDDDILPSKNLQRLTYQSQQDIPDAIGGFQPDMDPRLREVLEALEDEAYVDNDDDDDLFKQLAKDGEELDDYEFAEEGDFFEDDEDGGWETDDTAKPSKECRTKARDSNEVPDLVPVNADADAEGEEADVVKNENWLEDFKRFKKNQKTGGRPAAAAAAAAPSNSELASSIFSTTTNGGRRKKRKGALTSTTSYSMTSSSLVRTEQLSLLDARFEKLEEKQYNPYEDGEDDDDVTYSLDGEGEDGDDLKSTAGMSHMSTASSVGGPVRGDFDGILDDFLGGYSMHGKKHLKKGRWKSGPDQLDEIRRELGPAHIRGRYAGASSSKTAGAGAGKAKAAVR